ncbi:hypothetical protein V8G54_031747, partial [Vigna mungo]
FQRNRQGQPLHIWRSFLTHICKYWVAFIHTNLSPCSHVSDLTTSRVVLLFYILQGKQINVGRLIAQEINECAYSANSKSPLEHPSLITHLCELAGLPPPHRRPQPAQPNQLDQPAQPALPDLYHMVELKMALIYAKLDAIHHVELVMLRSLGSAFPDRQFISPEDFLTQVAWPGDPTHSSGAGGTSSKAQTMEMDDDEFDDDDEAEADDDKEEDECDDYRSGDSVS